MSMSFALRVSVMLLFASSAMAGTLNGVWTSSWEDDEIQISVRSKGKRHHQMNLNLPIAQLEGLPADAMEVGKTTPVRFRRVSEAGTIAFDGEIRDGDGSGHFLFTSSETFAGALAARGIGKPDLHQQLIFAARGMDLAWVDALRELGFRSMDVDDLVAIAIFDVTPEFVREMRKLGLNADLDDFLAFRIHGVTPAFAREMRAAGLDSNGDDLLAYRIHGVTPEFAAEMKQLGFEADGNDLVAYRIHGASPEYINELKKLGLTLDSDDLVAFRIHGVTADYIREMQALGLRPSEEQWVEMKIFGVDADFVRKVRQAGWKDAGRVASLIELKILGGEVFRSGRNKN